MNKTWKPVAAGILEIIAGGAALILACGLLMGGAIVGFVTQMPLWLSTLIPMVAIPLTVLGILDLAGGICALMRKARGMALAGSIAALISSPLLGIISLVLTVISIKEFISIYNSYCSQVAASRSHILYLHHRRYGAKYSFQK